MPAGVAGIIILIFVLLPCRGDKNDEREEERKSKGIEKEDDVGGFSRKQGETKAKDSYEEGKERMDESSFA